MEGDSDGDGDMSGGETERSGGSSRGPDRDSSAEEADEPDSDDSSEMDESECERRRMECVENLADLERQFTVLREQLYHERINHVEHQLAEPHVAKPVTTYLKMLQWEVLPYPPYSPDIAPSDFHLFRSMAHGLADQCFHSYEEAKKWIDSG
ncbi:Mariner Mos1 transposase [Eumeta japonica]|uniref:Mariner Mos1 transposase n=1 Tax=Eumeta variegata TaxID=151549 RepID=A0A4C1T853_EUMVA|nr:Mariner Mos1 transposase [Eumeta japonica]